MFDVAALSGAIGGLKVIVELARGLNNAQLSAKVTAEVAEIQMRLLTVQEQAIAIQAENLALAEENRKLKQTADVQSRLEVQNEMYWLRKEKELDGPFCTACFDKGDKLIRLHLDKMMGIANGRICPICQVQFLQG